MKLFELAALCTLFAQSYVSTTAASAVDGQSIQRFQSRSVRARSFGSSDVIAPRYKKEDTNQTSHDKHNKTDDCENGNQTNQTSTPTNQTSVPTNQTVTPPHEDKHHNNTDDCQDGNQTWTPINPTWNKTNQTWYPGKDKDSQNITVIVIIIIGEPVDFPEPLSKVTTVPHFFAKTNGTQKYTCKNSTYELTAIDATLVDHHGNKLGKQSYNDGKYKFDFTKSQHNKDAWFVGTKSKSLPSPKGPANLPWLEIDRTDGDLAKTVYRVNTIGGRPQNSTCDCEGDKLHVDFFAEYLFYS